MKESISSFQKGDANYVDCILARFINSTKIVYLDSVFKTAIAVII